MAIQLFKTYIIDQDGFDRPVVGTKSKVDSSGRLIVVKEDGGASIVNSVPFGQILDENGTAFASASALRTFVRANFFKPVSSTGSGAGNDASALTTGTVAKARQSPDTVYTADTQTLSNKSINAANNSITNIPAAALLASETLAFEPSNYQIKSLQSLGSNIKALGIGTSYYPYGYFEQFPMDAGGATVQAIYLDYDTVITGGKFIQAVPGVYTASSYNGIGLYKVDGTTITLVASSSNDGNIWKGAKFSIIEKAFTSPYSAVAGLYFLAGLYNASAATTAPQILATSNAYVTTLNQSFANNFKITGRVYPGSAFNGSFSASSIGTGTPDPAWAALY